MRRSMIVRCVAGVSVEGVVSWCVVGGAVAACVSSWCGRMCVHIAMRVRARRVQGGCLATIAYRAGHTRLAHMDLHSAWPSVYP